MNYISSLNHTSWECKYHVIWIPRYRKKRIWGDLRGHLTSPLSLHLFRCLFGNGHGLNFQSIKFLTQNPSGSAVKVQALAQCLAANDAA